MGAQKKWIAYLVWLESNMWLFGFEFGLLQATQFGSQVVWCSRKKKCVSTLNWKQLWNKGFFSGHYALLNLWSKWYSTLNSDVGCNPRGHVWMDSITLWNQLNMSQSWNKAIFLLLCHNQSYWLPKNIIITDLNVPICTKFFSKWPLHAPDIQQHPQAIAWSNALWH